MIITSVGPVLLVIGVVVYCLSVKGDNPIRLPQFVAGLLSGGTIIYGSIKTWNILVPWILTAFF